MSTNAVLSGALRYRTPYQSVHGRGRTGKKASPSSKRTDSFAFLNQPINGIVLSESPLMKLKTDGACERLTNSCRNVFRITGDGFRIGGDNNTETMIQTIEGMEKWAAEKDICFMAVKDYEDNIDFVLYNPMHCLELRAFFFYCAPADSLPSDTSILYKRYIRYISSALGIGLLPESVDNRYLDMMINIDEEMEDEDSIIPQLKNIYTEDGKLYHKFQEISDLPIIGLREDLEKHWKTCDTKCQDLVGLMYEGMDILPQMNLSNFDFNPYEDGFDGGDGYISLQDTLAILYSSNDGMDEELLTCADSDYQCGLNMQGWNRWLKLTPEVNKEDVDELLQDDSVPRQFIVWTDKFYDEAHKFDDYESYRRVKEEAGA